MKSDALEALLRVLLTMAGVLALLFGVVGMFHAMSANGVRCAVEVAEGSVLPIATFALGWLTLSACMWWDR